MKRKVPTASQQIRRGKIDIDQDQIGEMRSFNGKDRLRCRDRIIPSPVGKISMATAKLMQVKDRYSVRLDIASTRAVMLATILIAAKKAASKSTSRGMLNRPRSWLDFKVSLQPAAEMLVATRLAMSSKNCDMNSEFTAVTNRGTDFR